MGATRKTPSRRTRRILSGLLAGLLGLGAVTALALAGTQAAYATNPLTNDIPEFTPITHSPFLFQGTGDPGDVVTVISSASTPCVSAPADALGNWSCNVPFTSSGPAIVVTATRADDGTPAQDSEGWEYPVSLPVLINESPPGTVKSNAPTPTLFGFAAYPGATITAFINGLACTGAPVDGTGNWSCSTVAQLDGTYPAVVSQVVGGAVSDPRNVTYIADTTGPPIPDISQPYDSNLAPVNIQTSQSQPTFAGDPGTAEANATVHVWVSDFGVAPPAHPNGGPGNAYCDAVAAGDGSWSCQGAVLNVGHFYEVGVWATDSLGNGGASPDDEFAIEILPPPAAPVVINPQPGFGELSQFVVNGTVDAATTNVVVEVGGVTQCGGPIATPGGVFLCPGGAVVPVGPGVIDITAFDVYETGTTTSVNVDSWAQPTISAPALGFQTSASTVHVTGTAPVGSDFQVRLDGNPMCNIIPITPTYDCITPFVGVGGHALEVDYTDPWGTTSGTVNGGFNIVPTLPAPVFTSPIIGYQSTNRIVHVAMTNAAEGTIFVREGLFNICPPTPIAVTSFSCDTSQLAVGSHAITISQTDQYGVMSASAQRIVTILPTPNLPLSMKTFGFAFTVLGADGTPIGDRGLRTGDTVTILATGVPPGTLVQTEIHSDPIALGQMMVGQTGEMRITSKVPTIPPGQHEIVVGASGPGYWPASFATPIQVHGLKEIPEEQDPEIVKELGEPDEVKQLDTLPYDPAGGGTGPGGTSGYGFEDPTVFGSSVTSPLADHSFQFSPAGIVLSGSIAVAFLLLVGFPAELLESTIRSNYDKAFGWLARLRRRAKKLVEPIARALSHPWIGSSITVLVAALLLGFADPGYGFNGASVRLVLAMILAVVAINIGLNLIVMRVASRAFDVAALLKPMPAALAIVAISVLVSRLAGISPGFLFGVVLGVAYARELRLRDEARLGVLGVGLTIAAGLLAWLGYGLASAAASGPGFWNNLLIETLAAITLEALGTLVIALLPIEFLDGRTIFRWSKLTWLGLYVVTLLVFLLVVVPLSDNWGTETAPIFGWGTLFAVFAVVAIVTWAIFRRLNRATPSSPEAAPPRQRSRR